MWKLRTTELDKTGKCTRIDERDISLSRRSELLFLSELIAELDGKYESNDRMLR